MQIGDDRHQHVRRLHDLEFRLEIDRIEHLVAARRPDAVDEKLAAWADLDLRGCRENLRQDLVGHIKTADNGESENRKDHPKPISDDLKVFVKMKYLIAIF